jgi:hypothetical protein
MINDDELTDGLSDDELLREAEHLRRSQALSNHRLLCIYTPAGACPVALKSMDPEVVWAWADAIREYGVENGRFYTARAIHYWVREFYDINSPEFAQVCALIT